MQWFIGTSGYSYKTWRGDFYPADINASDMLSYYAERLSSVEINNTFYRMPRASTTAKWAQSVPANFRFVIKAPRRITHQLKLQHAEQPVTYLAKALDALGDRLGAVLFQCPPFLRCDSEVLTQFLNAWPRAYPAAFEFRHASWFCDETLALLSTHGATLCVSDDTAFHVPATISNSAWRYLRLRRDRYTASELDAIVRVATSPESARTFAFFKHETEGPELAQRLTRVADKRGPLRATRRRSERAAPSSRDRQN